MCVYECQCKCASASVSVSVSVILFAHVHKWITDKQLLVRWLFARARAHKITSATRYCVTSGATLAASGSARAWLRWSAIELLFGSSLSSSDSAAESLADESCLRPPPLQSLAVCGGGGGGSAPVLVTCATYGVAQVTKTAPPPPT